MKKPYVLLIAALICLTLSSCGKSADSGNDTPSTAVRTDTDKAELASEALSEAISLNSAAFIDIYSLTHPAKEAAILLTVETDISPLGFDSSFSVEKDGTFTDNNGKTREFYIVSFKGEPTAVISDYDEKNKSVLFNCINDENYPFALYEYTDSENGWTADKEKMCIPENYAATE